MGLSTLCPTKYTDQIDKILDGLITELFRISVTCYG